MFKLFKRKKSCPVAIRYCLVLNDNDFFFDSESAMYSYISEFSKGNLIHNMSMFKCEFYSLITNNPFNINN